LGVEVIGIDKKPLKPVSTMASNSFFACSRTP
jgi:hypothetical protein